MHEVYAAQQHGLGPTAVFSPIGSQWAQVTEGAFSSGVLRVIVFTLAWMTVVPALIIVFNKKNRQFARNFSLLSIQSTPTHKSIENTPETAPPKDAARLTGTASSVAGEMKRRQLLASLTNPDEDLPPTSSTSATPSATQRRSPAASTRTARAASTTTATTTPSLYVATDLDLNWDNWPNTTPSTQASPATSQRRSPAASTTASSVAPTRTALATSTRTTSPAASTRTARAENDGFPIYNPALFEDVERWEEYDQQMWDLKVKQVFEEDMTGETDIGSDSGEVKTPPHPATPLARRHPSAAAAASEIEDPRDREVSLFRSRPTPGLVNFQGDILRNACWFNSAIQCIANSNLHGIIKEASAKYSVHTEWTKGLYKEYEELVAEYEELPINTADRNTLEIKAEKKLASYARIIEDRQEADYLAKNTSTLIDEMNKTSRDEAKIRTLSEEMILGYLTKRNTAIGSQVDANNFITTLLSILDSDTDTCGVVFEHGYLNDYREIDTSRKFEVKPMAPIILRKTYASMQTAANDFLSETIEMKRYDKRTRKYADITNRDIFEWALNRADKKTQEKYEKFFALSPDGKYVYSDNNFRHASNYLHKDCRNLYDDLNNDLASGNFQILEINYNTELRRSGEIVEKVTRHRVTDKTKALVFATDTTQMTYPKVDETIVIEGVEWVLSSTIHHSGSLAGGHYTAYGRMMNGRYYYYNDARTPKLQSQPSNTFSTLVYIRAEQ